MLTVQPVQPVTTRADALVVRVEHWTPKGDCTERGDKERSDQKKVHQKIWVGDTILIIHLTFIKEISLKMNDIKKKLMHFNFIRESLKN